MVSTGHTLVETATARTAIVSISAVRIVLEDFIYRGAYCGCTYSTVGVPTTATRAAAILTLTSLPNLIIRHGFAGTGAPFWRDMRRTLSAPGGTVSHGHATHPHPAAPRVLSATHLGPCVSLPLFPHSLHRTTLRCAAARTVDNSIRAAVRQCWDPQCFGPPRCK